MLAADAATFESELDAGQNITRAADTVDAWMTFRRAFWTKSRQLTLHDVSPTEAD